MHLAHSSTHVRPVSIRHLSTAAEPMPRTPAPSPLLTFLRALSKEQREQVAAACGTTTLYLYQLAAEKHPNPRVRLAMSICAESRRLSRKVHSQPLTIADLTVGPADEDPPTN